MRKRLMAAVGVAILIGGVSPAGARTAGSAVTGSRYTVCNFDDPSVPQANKQFPFTFLLSTTMAHTNDRKVRKAVRSVQEILRAVGIRDKKGHRIVVDGVYGPRTGQAVRRFQRRQGLVVDGQVGPQTWRRLGTRFCWRFN